MPSDYSVTIKLDPFLQDFLRGYFQQPDGNFVFPKASDFNLKISMLLSKSSASNCIVDVEKEKRFTIQLWNNEYKNVQVYNNLSQRNSDILSEHIYAFFKVIFHEEVNKLRNIGFNKQESVLVFMSNYSLVEDYYDRLIKAYQRYMVNVASIKLRQKQKKVVR